MTALLTRCTLCLSPVGEGIDKLLRDGATVKQVSEWMEKAGYHPPHRNTFSTHRTEHLNHERKAEVAEVVATAAERVKREMPSDMDMAVLVRNRGVERLINREVDPTITEALRAQELIDKRAERGEDRTILVAIGLALSGGAPVALLGDGVTEGEFTDA